VIPPEERTLPPGTAIPDEPTRTGDTIPFKPLDPNERAGGDDS